VQNIDREIKKSKKITNVFIDLRNQTIEFILQENFQSR